MPDCDRDKLRVALSYLARGDYSCWPDDRDTIVTETRRLLADYAHDIGHAKANASNWRTLYYRLKQTTDLDRLAALEAVYVAYGRVRESDTGHRHLRQRELDEAYDTLARLDATEKPPTKPEGWPDKCHACGGPWQKIIWDPGDGLSCLSCLRTDAD